MQNRKIVLIGGSAGSVSAVQKLLSLLSPDFDLPIVVIQHLPSHGRIQLDLVYGHCTKRRLLEALDKMPIEKKTVYFAPPSYHLLIEKDLSFSLSQDDLVYFSRPSIQVSFESAAVSFGSECVAILLTGANEDGSEGLGLLREKGALTLVQDPETAEVPLMPKSALKAGHRHEVLSLEKMALRLSNLKQELHP